MEPINYENYFWQGTKIRLRPSRVEDWEFFYRATFDSEARRLLQTCIELPQSEEKYKEACEKFTDFQHPYFLSFAIETLSGELVGSSNIHGRDERNGTFSCAANIFNTHRKNGYGEESVRIMLRYAFYELRLQKCNTACLDGNASSVNMQKKLGFVEEGRRRRSIYTNGRFYDELLFGLTKEEFEENDRAYLAKNKL